eukprot:1156607-Pelagomonas_calceolata.AAC.8
MSCHCCYNLGGGRQPHLRGAIMHACMQPNMIQLFPKFPPFSTRVNAPEHCCCHASKHALSIYSGVEGKDKPS